LGETLYVRRLKHTTTISIDQDVATVIKEMCDRTGVPLSRLINALLELIIESARTGKAKELIEAMERVTGRDLKILRAVIQ